MLAQFVANLPAGKTADALTSPFVAMFLISSALRAPSKIATSSRKPLKKAMLNKKEKTTGGTRCLQGFLRQKLLNKGLHPR